MRVFRLAAFAVALSAGFSAQAADLTQAGPQASAAQIIAARGAALQPVLRLTFSVSGGDHTAPATLSIELAADYMFSRSDKSLSLYDYKLRRIFGMDESSRTFENDSLYAFVDFRRFETVNRRYLKTIFAGVSEQGGQAQDTQPAIDPFWVQSQLHVMDPADPVPELEKQTGDNGTIRYLYQAKEVASLTLSEQTLSDTETGWFMHVLQEKTQLHPLIIDALRETGRLPARLSFAHEPIRNQAEEVWILQSVSRVSASYPLTADYRSVPLAQRTDTQAFAAVVPLMLDAVAGRAGSGPRPLDEYRAAALAAAEQKNWFQALLLIFEVDMHHGVTFECPPAAPQGCLTTRDIVLEAQKDSRGGDLIRALAAPPDQREQALAALQAISRDGLSNAYVLDDFTANMATMTGQGELALPLLLNAVRGNPYLGGYYKDLGDVFRYAYMPAPAWICYDLGRALPGIVPGSVIDTMNAYESQLARQFPQFF